MIYTVTNLMSSRHERRKTEKDGSHRDCSDQVLKFHLEGLSFAPSHCLQSNENY